MEAVAAAKKEGVVTVTLGVTDPDTGESQTVEATILGGPTPVPELKAALQIAPDSSLWLIKKGKKKMLARGKVDIPHDVFLKVIRES